MSKGPSSVTLSPEAYGVLFLHTLRYTHRTVNGILLGSVDGKEASSAVTCK